MMFLETADGVAILGYAGLGETAGHTEPADWMSNVLRGRNIPLEPSLEVLAAAIKARIPRHLLQLTGAGRLVHNVVVPAFVGEEARLCSISIVFAPDRNREPS
jgi:hypothetical protein